MTRAEQYIIENHYKLSVFEMSHKLHLSKAKIQDILTAHRLTAKADEPIPKFVTRRHDLSFCKGRPESCFNCPYPDCVCKDSQNDDEIRYKFAGIRSDSETAEYQRKKGRTKK